jgi:hypothetical protein
MKLLILKSWLLLLHMEVVMAFGPFRAIHRIVRIQKTRDVPTSASPTSENICHAMDLACVLYFKQVLCLQRSAATTLLLRRYGWNADMAIGIQMLPFQSHAWVQIHDMIVNDRPYLLETYRILELC